MRIHILFSIIILTGYGTTDAQSREGNQGPDRSSSSFEISLDNPNDTLPAVYYYQDDLNKEYSYRDSDNIRELIHYDFSRIRQEEYIHLGNQGSSAFPIIRPFETNIGLNYGFQNYDIYKKSISKLPFFNLKGRAISDLYFSPNGQGNFIVKALFANSFKNDVNFSLDYARINQDGDYNNQETKSTAFSTGVHFSKNPRYELFLHLLINNHNEAQNGGVADTTLFNEQFYDERVNIPVTLNNASSRHEDFSYHAINILNLGGDSTAVNAQAQLHSSFSHGYFRFFDNNIESSEIDYYGPYLTDDRGIRHINKFKRISNDFSLSTTVADRINLVVGAKHLYHKINDDIQSRNINDLMLYGAANLYLTKKIKLSGRLDLGFANAAGNLSLLSNVHLPIGNLLSLDAGFNFSRVKPSLLEKELYITEQLLYENDFANPIHSELWARLSIPKLKTTVSVSQLISDNAIYLSEQNLFEQLEDIYSVSRVNVANEIKLGPLHLDHFLILQSINENVYGLPELFLKQRLYFNFKLFNKSLENNIGIEHRFVPDRPSTKYNPILGQVYRFEDSFDYYPELDLFALFNIDQFNFLLRLENLNSLVSNKIQYHVFNYPVYDFKIRIAARWLIRN